jgi:hypothetical protein
MGYGMPESFHLRATEATELFLSKLREATEFLDRTNGGAGDSYFRPSFRPFIRMRMDDRSTVCLVLDFTIERET